MDPLATLMALDYAMMSGDRYSVADHCTELINWLLKDGFMPVGPNGPDWRGSLTPQQFISMLRVMRHIAEMD